MLAATAAGLVVGVPSIPSIASRQATTYVAGTREARVALVLGGGGCRGYGHIGVLRALEAASYRPDLIVGSSVGSLVGALYAAGASSADLERYGRGVSTNTFRDWIFPKLGIFGGTRIARFVRERVSVGLIEALPTQFAAVATDLQTGELIVLNRGDIGLAVQASSSLPGLVEPVRIDGRFYVDGNLASPVPVSTARRLGASHVIAVDITFPSEQADLRDPYDALYQGFSILTHRLARAERENADVLIEPPMPKYNQMSSTTLKTLMNAGEQAAAAMMPSIKKIFSAARACVPRRELTNRERTMFMCHPFTMKSWSPMSSEA